MNDKSLFQGYTCPALAKAERTAFIRHTSDLSTYMHLEQPEGAAAE